MFGVLKPDRGAQNHDQLVKVHPRLTAIDHAQRRRSAKSYRVTRAAIHSLRSRLSATGLSARRCR
jgi:hypothetical protein